jgi:hypothetical protein
MEKIKVIGLDENLQNESYITGFTGMYKDVKLPDTFEMIKDYFSKNNDLSIFLQNMMFLAHINIDYDQKIIRIDHFATIEIIKRFKFKGISFLFKRVGTINLIKILFLKGRELVTYRNKYIIK